MNGFLMSVRGKRPLLIGTITLFCFSCSTGGDSGALSVCAVGDIFTGRGVRRSLTLMGYDPGYPFEEAAPLLRSADVAFGNLEGPIDDSPDEPAASIDPIPSAENDGILLFNNPGSVHAISEAGFDVLNLANNHAYDAGIAGLQNTIDALDRENIAHIGVGIKPGSARTPAVVNRKGKRILFLGYAQPRETADSGHDSRGRTKAETYVASFDRKLILEDIRNARDSADILIVSLHWGIEDSRSVSNRQKNIARSFIDAGADAVLGHHSHRFQLVEIYRGKPIAYSLGNFLFDQDDPDNQNSFILRLVFRPEKTTVELFPIRILRKNRTTLLSGPDALNLFTMMEEFCGYTGIGTVRKADRLILY